MDFFLLNAVIYAVVPGTWKWGIAHEAGESEYSFDITLRSTLRGAARSFVCRVGPLADAEYEALVAACNYGQNISTITGLCTGTAGTMDAEVKTVDADVITDAGVVKWYVSLSGKETTAHVP